MNYDITNIEFTCLVCKSKHWEIHLVLNGYEVIRCQKCGLGQTYPFPSGKQQTEVNKDVYTLENRLRSYEARFKELSKRYKIQLTEIKKYSSASTKNLLDVGCSLGFFLVVAQKMGFKTYGVELSTETADYAQRHQNLDVFCGTLEQAKYLNGQFDVVTLWDVLEHVPDPYNMLVEIHRILANNGLLVIQSPNMDSLMADIGREYWNWWLVPDHLYHFTPKTLRDFVSSCGFKVTNIYTWEPSIDFLMNWLTSKLHVKSNDASWKARLLRKLIRLGSAVFWPLAIPIQRMAWKKHRGALVTIYAHKVIKEVS